MRALGSSKSTRVSGRKGSAASGGAAGVASAGAGAGSTGAGAAVTGVVGAGGGLATADGTVAAPASPLGAESCIGGVTAQAQASTATLATATHA